MEEIKQNISKALGTRESKVLVKVLKIIGVVIVAMLIFGAGVSAGFHKAAFGRAWGEHYNENFGIGHRLGTPGMGVPMPMDYFPNAHGTTGKIIKIELPNIIVEDKDNTEKIVVIGTDSKIQKGRDTILANALAVDDFVIVIGAPDATGAIEAKLIRVLPNPEALQ